MLLVLAFLPAIPAVAFAQGFSHPLPTPPPVPVPGTRQLYPAASPFTPPSMVRPWVGLAPWWVTPGYYPWAYYEPPLRIAAPLPVPPLQGAGGPGLVLTNPELPAAFTIEFPTDATLWVNGEKKPGTGHTRVLATPSLKVGETHTFAVRAEWSADGKRYEWERTVTLAAGEKARATVVRGFPIKD